LLCTERDYYLLPWDDVIIIAGRKIQVFEWKKLIPICDDIHIIQVSPSTINNRYLPCCWWMGWVLFETFLLLLLTLLPN